MADRPRRRRNPSARRSVAAPDEFAGNAPPVVAPPADPDLPADADLAQTGLAPRGQGRVLLIACGALAREITALIRLNGWDHLDLACLPAILHNRPDRIVPALEAALSRHGPGYDRAFCVYADCGTGGALAAACERLGIGMIRGPHCYAFYEGLEVFEARGEIDAFYLTDFLARQFDAFVWKPLGLDRHPELRELYFGNYRKLVYQAQTEDPALTALAETHAARLGLEFERRFTGYGELATALETVAEG